LTKTAQLLKVSVAKLLLIVPVKRRKIHADDGSELLTKMDRPKLKICMLLPDFYGPSMPTSPKIREIYGNRLPHWGHEVTWIVADDRNTEEIKKETFKNVRIFAVHYHISSFLPKQFLAALLFVWKRKRLVGKIVKKAEKGGIIQVYASTFESILEGMLAIYLKRKSKIPFVFYYSFPIAEASLWKHRSGSSKIYYLIGKLEQLLLNFIMRRADLILPTSNRMMENLADAGLPKTKMIPLPSGVNAKLFSPSFDVEKIRTKYSLGDSKVIIYLGTMDKLRQVDILVHSLAQLKPARQNVKLLMVGNGNDRNRLERLVYNLGLQDEVIFTGQVPYFEVPEFIAAANVAVSPVPPLDIYLVGSPCKLFEYMGMAKPVIANEEIPEHNEVLKESGGGILVPYTPEAFARAIIELLDNPEKTTNMGLKGRDWVVKNRTYEILARKVEQRYFELLESYG